MPLGYKYAERSADSQLNWAEIGREASGMLSEVNRVREEKKAAYDKATRDTINNLMNSPQGQFENGNTFVNNFAHDAINQMKINNDLFKSGKMNERDYTLSINNLNDETGRLFGLQKAYQEEYLNARKGIEDNDLQEALTVHNMSSVEGLGDFANSKAIINPDGTVSVGLMENKIIDGKTVKVLSKDYNAPVSVWLGKIKQKPKKFQVEKETVDYVKNLGELKAAVYNAATTLRAGTIKDLTGLEFVGTIEDPATKAVVSEFNRAVDAKVGEWLTNKYNVISVLTENIGGKYNSDSFVYDKDVADKDPSKILLKIDPLSRMGVLDPTGKNFESQFKEASDYVRNQVISKIDEEVKVSTTGQLSESAETIAKVKKKYEDKDKNEEADSATNMIGKLYYGDDNQVKSAIDYFKGLKNKNGEILFEDINRDKTGISVILANGNTEHIDFLDNNNKPRTQEDFIASAGPLLAGQTDVSSSLKRGAYKKGAKFNEQSTGRGTTVKRYKAASDIVSLPSQDAVSSIQSSLPSGFKAVDTGGILGNTVTIYGPSKQPYIVKTKKSGDDALTIVMGLEDFVNNELKSAKGGNRPSTPANTNGVGSKY
jgi:hypothetical protein